MRAEILKAGATCGQEKSLLVGYGKRLPTNVCKMAALFSAIRMRNP